MRVWDVDPGYLNRQSLLGEHREIHAILSIVTNNKKGYAHHPETMRWRERLRALEHRHDWVVSEMQLRGYQHHSPAKAQGALVWPVEFVDPPGKQFAILGEKYVDREPGRMPLPRTNEMLWQQHKLSLLARDPEYCHQMERELTQGEHSFEQLALEITKRLRQPPAEKPLQNVLDLMWDQIKEFVVSLHFDMQDRRALITAIRLVAIEHQVMSLVTSTALGDLHTWILLSTKARKNENSKATISSQKGGSSCA